MTFAVLLHPKAARELNKIKEPTRTRIRERMAERPGAATVRRSGL